MIEREQFECMICHEQIETHWENGSLHGSSDYVLCGDGFVHTGKCMEEYLVDWPGS